MSNRQETTGDKQKAVKKTESKWPKLKKQQARNKRNNLTGGLSNKKSKILSSIQFTLFFNETTGF